MIKRKAKTLGWLDLVGMFPTEESAIAYLDGVRWGDSPSCTRCGAGDKLAPQPQVCRPVVVRTLPEVLHFPHRNAA